MAKAPTKDEDLADQPLFSKCTLPDDSPYKLKHIVIR